MTTCSDIVNDEEGEIFSESNHTLLQETLSNIVNDLDPDLPTEFGNINQATPVKDVVVEKENTEIDEWKSEKKVPVLAKKKSMESTKVSQPPATPKIMNVERQNVKEETEVRLHDEKFLIYLGHDFKDTGDLKSGRYYLPESPLLTMEGRGSGLLATLTMMAAILTLLFRGANG